MQKMFSAIFLDCSNVKFILSNFVMSNLVFEITSWLKNEFIYLIRKTRDENENEPFDCLL